MARKSGLKKSVAGNVFVQTTKREGGIDEVITDENITPTKSFDNSDNIGKVTVGGGSTINMKNYNSVKVYVEITIPTKTDTDDEIRKTAERASNLMDSLLDKEQKTAMSSFSNQSEIDDVFDD